MQYREGLFTRGNAYETFDAHKKRALAAVEQIPSAQFLSSTDEQLVDYVCSKMHIEPLVIYDDRATMDHQEIKVDASGDASFGWPGQGRLANGMRVTITIPFTGDTSLWHVRPSRHYMRVFPGAVQQPDNQGIGMLVLCFDRHAAADANEIKQAYEEELKLIKEMLANLSAELATHTQQLPGHVGQEVARRRARLGNQVNVQKILNIPMARRPGAPDTTPIIAPRKLVRPLPPAPTSKPEPTIRDEDYEHILNVIRHEGRSFETTPETFAKHGEEQLRDIVMAHLNGHYQGAATGERFRKNGKTDICIEDQNRAAFVAECKVWRGAKEVGDAANQLLSYLTWRDCKCCLVFFNTKVAGFSGVQDALNESLRKHEGFSGEVTIREPGEWRFRFKRPDEEQRIVAIHVFCFDLYVKPAEKMAKAKS